MEWVEAVADFFARPPPGTLVLFGVGNPIKRDDSVGLYIATRLRSRLGSAPTARVKIHRPVDQAELAISRLDLQSSRLLLFDAIEAGKPPGSVVFANLDDTKYGFFVTHNIPLRLLPSVRENGKNVFVLGVQPHDVGIGEGPSEPMVQVAEKIVSVVSGCIGGG
ncbi:MAG TPA: hydrogenase maturation protease [Nitrososphaerales archaeon]|nr:hydrogenase maturation protease [Nitrososphaerales archaeon]HUK75688.1 hydrogenase maturation protease [Nitrososphaerales archaeon]